MERNEEFARIMERLRRENEEIEAIRAAADTLRVLRKRIVDMRFD